MYKGRVAKSDQQQHPNLLDLSAVNVVTPCGNHGLPSTDSRGPSPLLDRWRLGGGCDCGGWDIACPLTFLAIPIFAVLMITGSWTVSRLWNFLSSVHGEEVANLLEAAVQEEEKRKVSKKIEEIQPSVKLNPPFSPMSRV
ncbi:hypothetical protein C3L33_08552, partial [Rhododendron williamsianum]